MHLRKIARGSVRARMTLLYGGLFAVITSGALIVAQQFQAMIVSQMVGDAPLPAPTAGQTAPPPPTQDRGDLQQNLVSTQRTITLIAIVVISVLAFAVCWWLTGLLLRPLHRVTATARRLSLSTLHERIALTGPQDELKELADTFDAMLDRLEDAIAGQRRFIANASHELRTPLAIQRAALEIGLANPTPAKLATIRTELLHNTQRSERLIEGLLVLAQGERGLDTRTPVELSVAVEQVIQEQLPLAQRNGVALTLAAHPVTVLGDEVLLTRLVSNLVQNAIRHNHPGGQALIELSPHTGLQVRNTGPRVRPDQVGELFEPFRRLHPDRTGSGDGAGLGLSIVAAITHAHNGTVQATANPDGGLSIIVALPALDVFPHQSLS